MTPTWLHAPLVAVLALVAGAATAQPAPPPADVAWERMPLFPNFGYPRMIAEGLAVLPTDREDGPPFRLYVVGTDFVVYDPERAAEQSERDQDEFGPWVDLCYPGACGPFDVAATEAGSLVGAEGGEIIRSTDGGATWTRDVGGGPTYTALVVFQPRLAARDAGGRAPVLAADSPNVRRSYGDGAEGTWEQATEGDTYSFKAGGDVIAFGEVPPSPALPNGRLLAGVWNGVTVSDDGGATWRPGEGAYGFAQYLGYSFAFVPDPAHPYGGAVLAGVDDLAFGRDSTATVYRSEDGGSTWARAHRFSPAALGLPDANRVMLAVTPDGAVWAGVSHEVGGLPQTYPAAVARSADGGRTWELVSAGVDMRRIYELMVGPDDRLYVATAVGVWHTAGPAYEVAGEDRPAAPPGLGVSAWPNPTERAATVAVELEAPGVVRVTVTDALGREVAALHDGPAADGQRWTVDTGRWAPGTYVVRAETMAGAVTAGLTVVR
ncbi:hypothetical protein [Rubrivirga sp.]|uniref:hypothetical protein n=1 Tax=Rubrivirga sp. TaxID=1885344 RepID=UPI003B51A67F